MKASLQTPFSSYIVRKLRPEEKVKSFDCGDADLNDFILNESGFYQQALLAVTYVFEAADDENHEHIAAYFSLANDRVSMSDFPTKTEFNRFRRHRFVNEKRLKSYPAAKNLPFGCQSRIKRTTHRRIYNKVYQKLLPRRQQDRLPFPHGRRIRRRHTFLFQAEVRAADGRRRGSRHTLALLRSERHRRLEQSQPMQ